MRDRVVGFLVNLIFRLATQRYRDFVKGAIIYGMNAAARDTAEGRSIPQHWAKYIDTAPVVD